MKIADLLSRVALRYAAADKSQNVDIPKGTPYCVCIYVDPNEPRISSIAALDESKEATFAQMVEAIAEDLQKPKEEESSTRIM